MQIQVHANHTVQTVASLQAWASREVRQALERYADELTSVDVHLSDVNSARVSADHKRCLIEARPIGRDPLAVNHQAERLDEALRGACDKLQHALDSALGKAHDLRRQRQTLRRAPPPG